MCARVIDILYLFHRYIERYMPLVNYWTIEHFVFGFGTSIIVAWLLRYKHRTITIPLIIILLWEVLEFRQNSANWIYHIGNNIVDVLIGLLGIFLGNKVYKNWSQRTNAPCVK
jgi:hypothetical protein